MAAMWRYILSGGIDCLVMMLIVALGAGVTLALGM
jgi:hypothetical protein